MVLVSDVKRITYSIAVKIRMSLRAFEMRQRLTSRFTVTILAFVYAPLNTVTSIYGMNIQQINNSGHNIGAFILTAVIVLITTAISWFTMEEINQTKSWQKENGRTDRSQSEILDHKNHSKIGVRIFMIWWLIAHGHRKWAWKSKALLRILFNESFPVYQIVNRGSWNERGSPCVYVAYFIYKWSSDRERFLERDPFSLADLEKDPASC